MNWGTKIIIAMSVFMAFILGLSFYMMGHNPELEEKDYYEKDINYQQQLDARRNQEGLNKKVAVDYLADKHSIQITYPENMKNITGKVFFIRPSDAGQDFDKEIEVNENNVQIFPTQNLKAGLWRIKVEWQMDEKLFETRTYEFMIN
jgi:nitrogen fixation protein FixH